MLQWSYFQVYPIHWFHCYAKSRGKRDLCERHTISHSNIFAWQYLSVDCPNKSEVFEQLHEYQFELEKSQPLSDAAALARPKWHVG